MNFEGKYFSKDVTEYRKRSGLSQDEVAEIIGISRQKMANGENEDEAFDLDSMLRVSTAIDMPPGLLFKGGENKKIIPKCIAGLTKIKGEDFLDSGLCEIKSDIPIKNEELFCIIDYKTVYLASAGKQCGKYGFVFADNNGFLKIAELGKEEPNFIANIIADITSYIEEIGS